MDEHRTTPEAVAESIRRAMGGGAEKYHQKLAEQGKLFVRERLRLLLDDADGFTEEGLLVGALAGDLPADAVVTGIGSVHGRPVAVMANDSTVKAGSWGPATVEKIIRIIELARKRKIPLVYLVDSAGARIDRQVEMFPGRRGAGKIFYNQVQASGRIPQVCCLLGPSAAGGAYIPSLCDVVFMVERNASMYLGSPRMAEEVIGEKVTLEEMGGARMHCEVSGSGDLLVPDDKAAIEAARAYLSYFPQHWREAPPEAEAPGFMVGTAVERQGIIRHGAKMITAVSEATVPKICVIVRKAYGAGLYAMAGPGFEPDATIALPTARIAVMGPEPAVNAVYYNKIEAIENPAERKSFVDQ